MSESDRTTAAGSAYSAAGVDIDAGERAVALMRAAIRSTYTPQVLAGVGSFGALFRAPGEDRTILVSSTDGVGTKLKVAIALNQHDTIGHDLVHHCIDDILTMGARPLFFLDYLAVGTLVPEMAAQIVGGLAAACKAHGVALIGGETAEMFDLYARGDYDLAGFIVGAVADGSIVDGSTIAAGDVLIGLPSDGLHTNGYTLARRVLATMDLKSYLPELGHSLGDELLRPHRCYLPEIGPLLPRRIIKGMAHITGGGLPGNLPRILPAGLAAALDPGTWPVPPIFGLIAREGRIDRAEMYRVFNMGIGFVVVASPENSEALLESLDGAGVIGRVVPYDGVGPRVMGLA